MTRPGYTYKNVGEESTEHGMGAKRCQYASSRGKVLYTVFFVFSTKAVVLQNTSCCVFVIIHHLIVGSSKGSFDEVCKMSQSDVFKWISLG